MHAIEAGQFLGGLGRVTGGFAAGDQWTERVHKEGGVRHRRGVKVRIDAEVQHDRAGAEPAAAGTAEGFGTDHFGEAHHVDVELRARRSCPAGIAIRTCS